MLNENDDRQGMEQFVKEECNLWKRCLTAMMLVCMAFASVGCGGNAAEVSKDGEYQKIKLVMTVNGTNIATDTKVAMHFAELVDQESKGNIKIDVFPNDQLAGGNATKGIEMIADGAVDLAAYASSTMSVLDERLLVGTIPWAFNNYQDARRIIDSTGGEYYAKVLKTQGITYLGSAHNGFRQITNGKHAVKTPEDVKGLKIRVPGGEVYINFFKAFDADPVAMSWSEAFTAIQQGTIDGQENGFSVTNSAKVDEIQQYMTVWNYTYENYLFVANEKIFENLEPKTRELLRVKAKEACNWGRDMLEADEKKIKEKFVGEGMEVTELDAEQLKPFQAKVQPMVDRLKEKYGPEACEAFQIR